MRRSLYYPLKIKQKETNYRILLGLKVNQSTLLEMAKEMQ